MKENILGKDYGETISQYNISGCLTFTSVKLYM